MTTLLHDEDEWEVVDEKTDPCDEFFSICPPRGATQEQVARLARIQASLRECAARISRVHFSIMMEETIRGTPSVVRAALVGEARALGYSPPKMHNVSYKALLVERAALSARMQFLLKERTKLRLEVVRNEAD